MCYMNCHRDQWTLALLFIYFSLENQDHGYLEHRPYFFFFSVKVSPFLLHVEIISFNTLVLVLPHLNLKGGNSAKKIYGCSLNPSGGHTVRSVE